jgi:hypothetical protein
MKNLFWASSVGLVLIGAISAQETPPFAFNVGGGFTETLGATGRRIDPGWNFDAGAGYTFHPRPVTLQFNYNQLDVNTTTVNALTSRWEYRQWSLTLDPVIHEPAGTRGRQFLGGGGLYQRGSNLRSRPLRCSPDSIRSSDFPGGASNHDHQYTLNAWCQWWNGSLIRQSGM